MDSEQKFEKALERAKTYYDTTDSVADTELLELIFPELKEEDERMRKWLIDYLDNRVLNSPSRAEKEAVSKSIAWLEKQRNKDEEILVLKYQIESLHAAIKATKNIHKIELEKLGFTTDKVEPKYNIGDWVVNRFGDVWHIYSFDSKNYQVSNGDKYCYFPIEKQNEMHLWTIQDVKDGDVLAAEPIEGYSSSFVAICKKLNEEDFDSYCFVGFDGYFYEDERGHSTKNIHPATKEQRDTLMKEMAYEGYTFDFEKKKLKKIEHKSTDKVKPKYNIGDWLVHNERKNIVKIVNYTPFDYKVVSALGYHHSITNDAIENNYHLWTIQDAKNGDVLFYRGNVNYSDGIKFDRILLFENLDKSFFVLTKYSNGVEDYGIDVNIDYPNNIVLATKEQKEILFMAMADAGYTFDFEKKEVKRIYEEE